jgi:serine/threonine protein kinase
MSDHERESADDRPLSDWTVSRGLERGEPNAADEGFTPGTMLADRYRVVALLGRGGMGQVYRAEDTKLGQAVALKFVRGRLSPDRLQRLYAEVRIGREVSHPNVCRLYDIVELDGQTFIAMEYVDGEDLASALRRMGRPSGDKAVSCRASAACPPTRPWSSRGTSRRGSTPSTRRVWSIGTSSRPT